MSKQPFLCPAIFSRVARVDKPICIPEKCTWSQLKTALEDYQEERWQKADNRVRKRRRKNSYFRIAALQSTRVFISESCGKENPIPQNSKVS